MKNTGIRSSSFTLAVLAALSVAGCGGGGGGGGSSATASAAPAPEPVLRSDVSPSCSDCAATSSTTYAGSGVGIWHKTNTGTSDEDVTIGISGIAGQHVTLILTNETNTAKTLPAIKTSIASAPRTFASVSRSSVSSTSMSDAKAEIAEFNRTGWAEVVGQTATRLSVSKSGFDTAPKLSVVGDTRSWNHIDSTARNATLKRQATMSDGVVLNLWLENTEFVDARVTNAMLDKIMATYAGSGKVYDLLKDAGGPLWGAHSYPAELVSATKPIEIVLLNFDNNQQPYGVLGYFAARNSIQKTLIADSNESVSIYMAICILRLESSVFTLKTI